MPMTGTSRPRSWRRNSKRPRPTRTGRGPLWPVVSHGVHPHPKGLGVRAVVDRAVLPPLQHVACLESRNDCPHSTPPLQLYAESWYTARCTSSVYKCTMCSFGLQGHAGRGTIGAMRACRPVTICKRFGAMWVLFPWINANVIHAWLHSSPRHGGHLGGVFRFGCIGWCPTVGHTSKGGGIVLNFPPFPRNGGTKLLKSTSAIASKGGS